METQDARELDFSGKFFLRINAIPRGIKLITWARTIYWFGWGFGETLIPIYILMFSASLTEAGLVNASFDVLFLVSVPFVGIITDAVSSKTLLIIGLCLYPFIGISYYLAGATGLILFIILARAINGISSSIYSVATDTYIRRVAQKGTVASAFGYIASLANFGWVVAAIAGVYLVRFVSIGELLLLITPFSLLAFIPLLRAPKDAAPPVARLDIASIGRPLVTFLKEIAAMQKGLNSVVFLMFILNVASVAATFFIPIDAYKNGASLSAVALLVVISALPTLSEFWLAEFIDGSKLKRKWSLFFSLAALPLLFVAAGLVTAFSGRILIALGIETAAILGSLALESYATVLSRRDRYGEISSVLEGAATLGDLAGPIAIGILTDAIGFTYMFAVAAALFCLIAIYYFKYPIER